MVVGERCGARLSTTLALRVSFAHDPARLRDTQPEYF